MTAASVGTLADEYTYTDHNDDDNNHEGGNYFCLQQETVQSPLSSQEQHEEEGGREPEMTQTTTPSTVSSLGDAGAFQSPPPSASPSLMSIDDGVPTPVSVSLAHHHPSPIRTLRVSALNASFTMQENSPNTTATHSDGGDMMSMSSASPDYHQATR